MVSISVGAPGISVSSRASGAVNPVVSSFNTVYMVGQCDEQVSIANFPYNTPVLVSSLIEYVNLIGGVIPSTGPALVSYLSAKAYFRNAQAGRLYVMRVGRPPVTSRVQFNFLNAFKDNGLDLPSAATAGDVIYIRLSLNGFSLGEINNNGTYLGISFELPNSLTTEEDRNVASKSAVEAVVKAIQNDQSVSDFAYVRDYDTNSLDLTSRIYGQSLSVLEDTTPPNLTEPIFIFNGSFYTLENVSTATDREAGYREAVDYIQAIETGFTGSLEKGYLMAPAAYDQFPSEDRVRVGRAMTDFCSRQDSNWVALIDPGPSQVSNLSKYEGISEGVASEGFLPQVLYKSLNSIYRYVGSSSLTFSFANENESISAGSRLAISKPVTIAGKSSDVVQAKSDGSFNDLNLPGSLQSPTKTYALSLGSKTVTLPVTGNVVTLTGHGYASGEKVYVAGDLDSSLTLEDDYYVITVDGDSFSLATNLQNVFAGIPVTLTGDGGVVDLYGDILVNGVAAPSIPILKGRKYQLDLSGLSASEELTFVSSVDPRITHAATAVGVVISALNTFRVGDKVHFEGDTDTALIPITEVYYVSSATSTEFSVSTTLGGTAVTLNGDSGVAFVVKSINVGIEDGDSINRDSLLSGSNDNYVITPEKGLSDTIYLYPLGKNLAVLPVGIRPSKDPVASLWNFQVVTFEDLIDEGIRTSVIQRVEDGLDSHNLLYQDSQKYGSSKGYCAYYAPYILNIENYLVPPSAYVAGIAVRRERNDGISNPPAGTEYPLIGALRPEIDITEAQQSVSNPNGMNALRILPGSSDVVIWGARTRVNPNNPAQKVFSFITSRVITNVVISSLQKGFDDLIFSSIDGQSLLFTKIRTRIDSILYTMYAQGNLFGNTPSQAYKVIVDGQNNLNSTIDNGIVFASVYISVSPILESLRIDLINTPSGAVQISAELDGFQ